MRFNTQQVHVDRLCNTVMVMSISDKIAHRRIVRLAQYNTIHRPWMKSHERLHIFATTFMYNRRRDKRMTMISNIRWWRTARIEYQHFVENGMFCANKDRNAPMFSN